MTASARGETLWRNGRGARSGIHFFQVLYRELENPKCSVENMHTSMMIAKGTQQAMAHEIPTSATNTVACHTVLTKKVDIIKSPNKSSPAVQTFLSMNGMGGRCRGRPIRAASAFQERTIARIREISSSSSSSSSPLDRRR
jgi:hypothetical protein